MNKKRSFWQWFFGENDEVKSKTFFRVTGVVRDSRSSKGYQSTLYKCAQDKHVVVPHLRYH